MSLQSKLFSLLIVCFASVVLLAQEHTQQNAKNPLAGNPAAVAAGRRLYEQACQSCHGGEGRGDRAPALTGGTFKHGGLDGEIFLNIRNGIASTQMPPFKRLTTEQVWQIVSYVRSLNGATAATPTERTAGNLLAGEQLFFGKANCAACHEVKRARQQRRPGFVQRGQTRCRRVAAKDS